MQLRNGATNAWHVLWLKYLTHLDSFIGLLELEIPCHNKHENIHQT